MPWRAQHLPKGGGMSDRELLELAAKAAGMQGCVADFTNPERLVFLPDGSSYEWNPLTDDGDALRLAVKLSEMEHGVTLLLNSRFGSHGFAQCCTNTRVILLEEYMRDDPYAATRRAIVRAAAAVGASQ